VAFVSEILAYGGLILQVIALVLLIRGPVSRYFPLFLYLFTFIAVTLCIAWVYRTQGVGNELYFNVYWGGEMLTDLLSFFLVISLTMRALEGNPLRPKMVRLLAIIVLVALVAPFILFESSVFGRRWNQSVGQLFNFGAAVMNLVLWGALIVSKQRDRQLLTVSAGLGVTVAGAALTLGVRQFTNQDDVLRTMTDAVYRISQIASPLIWCWAFRPGKPNLAVPPPVGNPTTSAS
jgi:hypothetical protein